MTQVDEKIDMGNHTKVSVCEMGVLNIEFDDGDEQFDLGVNARELFEHLREFFDE